MQRIAIIGSGIAGLSATWLLRKRYDVRLFEQNDYIGGHTHTLEVPTSRGKVSVDTGFMVFNQRNYPLLTALFRLLGVNSQPTDMSFSASIDQGRLEYAGSGLNSLFAQRKNVFAPFFLGMLWDIVRFNRAAKQYLQTNSCADISLGEYLQREGYSRAFRNYYLLPMAAAIWSCPTALMLRFPLLSFARFFANHGLLDLRERPQWYSVSGGSHTYVRRMLQDLAGKSRMESTVQRIVRDEQGIWVHSLDGRPERFDQVVLACHADQALAMIDRPTNRESGLLDAFRYQKNRVLLHSDPQLMPRRKQVWSSWNYLATSADQETQAVSVTYWMNRLQNLDTRETLFVSLNPTLEPRPERLIREMSYEHPVFDEHAIMAQQYLGDIQGRDRLWFCGSYCGYGFHEDALASSVGIAKALGAEIPWKESNHTPTVYTPSLQETSQVLAA